jgi:HD-GYP domain-containing protein (c-di-GMP phosphodiesterase class II)
MRALRPPRVLLYGLRMPASNVRKIGTARGSAATREEGREPSGLDRLIRRLRVSDPPDRYQRMATESLRLVLRIAAVAWVPASAREPVVVSGSIEGLAPDAFRGLIHGSHPPGVGRLSVVSADSGDAAGWLLAADPRSEPAFTEAELGQLLQVAALVAAQRSNARTYADLKDLLFGVIRALTSAIDAKDPYTSGHSERVARIAVRLGETLGMSANQRGDLYLMGLLHDVGKIGIDDGVLKKTGPLTEEEFRLIQSHVRIGVHILSDLKKLHHLLPGVAHHHESLDGSGYPSGLAGDAIPLEARILAVADAFDAMSSNRPYRRRLTPAQIDENFTKGSGVQWDPKVVEALFASRGDLDRIRQKGLGESLNRVVDETLGRS